MSRFRSAEHFWPTADTGYKLTPFRFAKLDHDRYVATNMVGEYSILRRAELQSFVDHSLERTSPTYSDLKSKHFLIDADSDVGLDLLALKARTKLARLADFTSLHLFVVSLRCDHSCPYCQVSRQSEDRAAFDMSPETARKSLDLVFRSPAHALKVEFQGGESLLNFPLIQQIVRDARERNVTEQRDLQFVIATNLSPLTDEILQFCFENGIHISTSLDGPEWLHNANRPRPGKDSYELAIRGIERAQNHLGKDRVSALMTTTERSLDHPREIIDEYLVQGLPGIFLRPLSPYGFAIKTKSFDKYSQERWLEFYKQGLSYILEINKSGLFFPEYYASTVLTKMLTPFEPGYVDLMSPAGVGTAALVYNYDGDVYASDESRMLAEMGDQTFRLGNIRENSYEELLTSDSLLEALEVSFAQSVPMCVDCAFEPYCGADPVYHHATQGDLVGKKPLSGFCTRNMEISKHLIRLLEDDPEAEKILRGWVTA